MLHSRMFRMVWRASTCRHTFAITVYEAMQQRRQCQQRHVLGPTTVTIYSIIKSAEAVAGVDRFAGGIIMASVSSVGNTGQQALIFNANGFGGIGQTSW